MHLLFAAIAPLPAVNGNETAQDWEQLVRGNVEVVLDSEEFVLGSIKKYLNRLEQRRG